MKDINIPIERVRELAEQGDAKAQFNLGTFYELGKGVKQDTNEAVLWWQKSAEQGIPQAQHNLGKSYAKGDGVKQDYEEAAKWWTKSAEQGYADSFEALEELIKMGVIKNPFENN